MAPLFRPRTAWLLPHASALCVLVVMLQHCRLRRLTVTQVNTNPVAKAVDETARCQHPPFRRHELKRAPFKHGPAPPGFHIVFVTSLAAPVRTIYWAGTSALSAVVPCGAVSCVKCHDIVSPDVIFQINVLVLSYLLFNWSTSGAGSHCHVLNMVTES